MKKQEKKIIQKCTNFMLTMRLFKRSYALLSPHTNNLGKTTQMQEDLVRMETWKGSWGVERHWFLDQTATRNMGQFPDIEIKSGSSVLNIVNVEYLGDRTKEGKGY